MHGWSSTYHADGKPMYSGLENVAWVIGYMPMIWNIRLKRYEAQKKFGTEQFAKMEETAKEIYNKAFKELTDEQKRGIREVVKEESKGEDTEIIEGEKQVYKFGKKEVKFDEPTTVWLFKVCSPGFFSKLLASVGGFSCRYFLIDEIQVDMGNDAVRLKSGLQPQLYFGHMIFSQSSRNIVENTSFKINRQSEIQEIGNDVSRTIFWDNEFRKRAMAMREQAQIEAEKFRSQKEGQQD
jgi:hypothetical protein